MNNFFRKTRRHFLPCEDTADGSQLSCGGNIFFQLNKEELSLHATMDLVGPSRQALHVQSSSDDSRLLTTPHRTQRGGGRRRGSGQERLGDGKMRQWSRRLRGVRGLTGFGAVLFGSRWRITRGVGDGGIAWLAVG